MLSYLDTLQVLLAALTVVGLAYFTGFLKMFTVQDVSSIRRVIFLVAYPAMIFRQLGNRPMNYETWQPFINTLLTQVTVHLLIFLVAYAIPGERYIRFIQAVFSCTYSSFFYNYPIVQVFWGDEALYIPLVASLVHCLVMTPLHSVLIYGGSEEEQKSDSEAPEEEEIDDIEEGVDKGGPIHPIEGHGDEQHQEAVEVEDEEPEQNQKDTENPEQEPQSDDGELHPEDVMEIDDVIPEEEEQKETPAPVFWKALLWTVVTPMNVCIILGIIWSFTGWTMPPIISNFVYNLEKAVPAAGLFCIGTFLWEHPFFGCNWLEVGIYLAVHFVVMPLVAALWAWILKFENKMAMICTLINTAPASLTGYVMTINCGYGMKSASFTFFWSNLIFIAVFFLWVLALNKTGLFAYE